MKSSTFSRTVELARLAAKVGLKELRSGSLKSKIEQATLIAQSLSNLKGAAMKAGQLLSLDLNHYFPPEAIEVLSKLQNSAIALPFEQIQAILLSELGEMRFKTLEDLSRAPIGVASIGQVHRASFRGKEIVLKVQYPGVADSVEADLKILKGIALSFCRLTGRSMDLEPLFQEFGRILKQEVDYKSEFNFQEQYASHVIRSMSDSGVAIRVPKLVPELCTPSVLSMTFEDGVSLREWIASRPSLKKREQLATAILDLYFHEFFEWGFVQTDPNWANFLVQERDDALTLVVLDFGAVRQYSREFIKNYIELLRLASSRDSKELKAHAIQFGLIDSRESEAAFQAFDEMLKTAILPFFPQSGQSAVFDFGDQAHSLNSQKRAKALYDELVYSPPPYGLVFLHRKLAGVYSILKSLEVRLDVSGYWQKMQELSARFDAHSRTGAPSKPLSPDRFPSNR